jgi:hypothetical protein
MTRTLSIHSRKTEVTPSFLCSSQPVPSLVQTREENGRSTRYRGGRKRCAARGRRRRRYIHSVKRRRRRLTERRSFRYSCVFFLKTWQGKKNDGKFKACFLSWRSFAKKWN